MSSYPTDAPCIDAGHLFFEPDGREDPTVRANREADARDLCSTCPVAAACLAAAMDAEGIHAGAMYRHGIWGGLNPTQRQTLGRRMRADGATTGAREPKPITHGTPGGYELHRRRKVPMCEPCRTAERAYRLERYAARARQAVAS